MGYRSDVMVLIYPEPGHRAGEDARYEQLKVLIGATFKDVSDEFGGYMTWIDADRVLKFNLPDVKWYPSYPDVQMFEAMVSAFDGTEAIGEGGIGGYCTEYIRIGEESDDTEERHTGDDNQYYLTVRRSIDCNV